MAARTIRFVLGVRGLFKLKFQHMDEIIIILTNLPDRASALKLAGQLVEQRLAACVNVLAECSSVYRWEGKIKSATEVPVLIKSRAQRYDEVEAAIRRLHPYELPEIVAVPMVRGLDEYLEWVAGETTISIG